MSELGSRLIAGLQEALAVARGEVEPAGLHIFLSPKQFADAELRAEIAREHPCAEVHEVHDMSYPGRRAHD